MALGHFFSRHFGCDDNAGDILGLLAINIKVMTLGMKNLCRQTITKHSMVNLSCILRAKNLGKLYSFQKKCNIMRLTASLNNRIGCIILEL